MEGDVLLKFIELLALEIGDALDDEAVLSL